MVAMSATDPNPPRRLLPARLPFFYGWLILPAAGIALFASGPGQTYTISIFVEPIIEETGWSRTLVSSLYTAGSLTAALAMMGVGRLLDRFGARVMLIAVGVVFGACLFGMSKELLFVCPVSAETGTNIDSVEMGCLMRIVK